MKRHFLQLGIINVKLLIPIGLAFFLLLQNILDLFYPKEWDNLFMDYLVTSLSQISIIIVPNLKIFSSKREQLKVHKKKTKSCCHFFILGFLLIVFFIIFNALTALIYSKISESGKEEDPTAKLAVAMEFAINECIETIFICILTFIMLKTKYHLHHIISLTLFIILCLIIDYSVDNLEQIKNYLSGTTIILFLVYLLVDSLITVYEKHMIDNLYYSFWTVRFANGMYSFLILMGLLSGEYLPYLSNGNYIIFEKFISGFHNVKGYIIIIRFIIAFIVCFFYHLFFILTLNYFTPNHILISMEISKMLSVLLNSVAGNKIIVFILFLLNLFCLLVYLEIIELNFCGLNENVRRNISIRGNYEMTSNREVESEMIDIGIYDNDDDENEPDYYTKKQYDDRESYNSNDS